MRFCRLFSGVILVAAAALAACEKTAAPVRLDFVGDTNLTSSDRILNAADTFRTRVFAAAVAGGPLLKHLKISVTYSPGLRPINYPVLLSSFKTSDAPPDTTLILLDKDLPGQPPEYRFTPTFGARSTSGTERWTYTVTDVDGQTNTRSYRLTVRKADSAAVYQSYALLPTLQPNEERARPYFALRPGLLLPRFAVDTQPATQAQIDLVAVNDNGGISLAAPKAVATWPGPKRATTLRRTTLDATKFTAVLTAAGLATEYNNAPPAVDPLRSGSLTDAVVLAFRTEDGRYGLLSISKPTLTPFPAFSCAVRMQK